MKNKLKYILLISIVLSIVGGFATYGLSRYAASKFNSYAKEIRDKNLVKQDLVSTKESVKKLVINSMPEHTIINVHKSNNGQNYIKVKSYFGKDSFLGEFKENAFILSSALRKEGPMKNLDIDPFIGIGDKRKNNETLENKNFDEIMAFIDYGFNKEYMETLIDRLALMGSFIDVNGGFHSGVSKDYNQVDIFLKDNIDIDFEGSLEPIYDNRDSIFNVDAGMIRDYVKFDGKVDADVFQNLYLISYKGRINKMIFDNTSNKDEYLDADIFNGIKHSNYIVNSLIFNLHAKTGWYGNYDNLIGEKKLEDKKVANEIVYNIYKNSDRYDNNYSDRYMFDLKRENVDWNAQEEAVLDKIDSMIFSEIDDGYGGHIKYYKNIEKYVKSNIDLNNYVKIFKDDLIDFTDNDEYFAMPENYLSERFDFVVPVIKNSADKITINAKNLNLRIMTYNDDNYNMDLKASAKIDFRYFMYGKLSSENLLKILDKKEIRMSVDEFEKSISKDAIKKTRKVEKPIIKADAKYIRPVLELESYEFQNPMKKTRK